MVERQSFTMMGGDEAHLGDGKSPAGQQRKSYWRSVSWTPRSSFPNSGSVDSEASSSEMNKALFEVGGVPLPLTPRSRHNCKARAALPPLQPLAISRRTVDEWPKAGCDDLGEWPNPSTPGASRTTHGSFPGQNSGLPSSEKREFQFKKDKIAFFDKECSRIAEHIYLGSDAVAKNRDILRRDGITHVLNCVGYLCQEYFKDDLVYKTLWLQDSPSEDITSILYDVFDYFEDVREQGGRVFVHCYQGVSRSTSLVIAYLMWREGRSFEEAFQYVKSARGITNPNMGFTCQLLQCQKRVHAVPLSPSSVVRLYRMAPHSPFDPLHLVPKSVNHPLPNALDSRGAFLLHVPSAIYVWIGKYCEAIMAKDAKAAAFQVVRYERAEGPVVTVEEGREPEGFWEGFSVGRDDSLNVRNSLKDQISSVVNLGIGSKKVESYDLDFSIFKRAVAAGGVLPLAGSHNRLPTQGNGWGVLRKKFSNGGMKDLVVASNVSGVGSSNSSPSQEYLDSHNNVNSNSGSPSSLPSDSPSLSDTSLSSNPSPASSIWSDASFMSSKSTSPIALFDARVRGNSQLELKPPPILVSSPPLVQGLSLAQRRGSISPSLNLPSILKRPQSFSSGGSVGYSPPLKEDLSLNKSQDSRTDFAAMDSLDRNLASLDLSPVDVAYTSKVHDSFEDDMERFAFDFDVKASVSDDYSIQCDNQVADNICMQIFEGEEANKLH